ncbi:hypothetical protein FHT76_000892 [Rhizobium sp. BK176]|nr:hypothetical protein [Rhizobium sp. BK176]
MHSIRDMFLVGHVMRYHRTIHALWLDHTVDDLYAINNRQMESLRPDDLDESAQQRRFIL